MTDNQFSNAMDAQSGDADTDDEDEGTGATESFIERANAPSASKSEHTVGVGVSEEMHYLYRELKTADEVDVDIAQSFRDQIERLARRNEDVADRARQKYELDHDE